MIWGLGSPILGLVLGAMGHRNVAKMLFQSSVAAILFAMPFAMHGHFSDTNDQQDELNTDGMEEKGLPASEPTPE